MKKSSRKSVQILGVNISITSTSKVLTSVANKLSKNTLSRLFLTTLNPEILILAQENTNYKEILNKADIAIPDGVGLVYANKITNLNTKNDLKVIRGRELFLELIGLASDKNWKVFLLGGVDGSSSKAKNALEKLYPNLNIKNYDGPLLDIEGRPLTERDSEKETKALRRINIYKPHLLFVAYGAPKQERWIAKWLENLDVGLAMGVGGTFDYVSGISKLPPKILAELGLEWFWRLLTDPKRFTRIFNAVIIFPLMVLDEKIQKN